ncbi:MAG: division/cell wall cluster transcriptional repressor MraZ [Tepidiformaceae bacterium]
MDFTARNPYQLDEKKRVPMPPRFRGAFDGPAVLTTGRDQCIEVYTLQAFDEAAAKLKAVADTGTKEGRQRYRWFFGNANRVTRDTQGRLNIPETLIEYAALTIREELVVVGMGEYFEIWDKKVLDAHESAMKAAMDTGE